MVFVKVNYLLKSGLASMPRFNRKNTIFFSLLLKMVDKVLVKNKKGIFQIKNGPLIRPNRNIIYPLNKTFLLRSQFLSRHS